MKIQNENTRMYSQEQVSDSKNHRVRQDNKKEKSKTFFAGNLNTPANSIEEKRKMAQKQALKVVGDVFANHKKVDEDLNLCREKIQMLHNETKEAQEGMETLEKKKIELMESCGVKADSQEQKDLELLEKNRQSRKDPKVGLTKEERARVKEIYKEGLSEYQEAALDLSSQQDSYRKIIDDNEKEAKLENAILRGVALEQLKDTSMIKAEKQSDEIMANASAEIMGMLMEEAKDHVEEEQEKAEEAAEAKAEEKKEVEEQQEAIQEKLEQMEALAGSDAEESKKQTEEPSIQTEQMLNLDKVNKDIKKEVQNIVDEMKLVIADIKGSKVDTEV